ncbi:MAG: V-type ATPase subunit, partial [Bacillota bacterium]|nr:V-type ATPase subunit [Bacillota bacterium]
MRGDQRYAGLFTKIHALYGKRLRSEDYKRMSAMHSLSELVVYLKRYPGWSGLLSSIDEYNVRRGYLESVIKRSFFQEYERLMHFVPEKDKELLSFPIRQNEIELILEFLRCLSLNQLEDFSVNLPAFFAKHSKIKLSALQNANTYDELLAALRKTGYYGALSRLAPGEDRQIDYNTRELVLWQNFYESILSAIKENYTGETRA